MSPRFGFGDGFFSDKDERMREQWEDMMSTASGIRCVKKLDFCPKGHEMETCQAVDGDTGRYCKQCGSSTFQPNENRFGDQCRLRKTCGKPFMTYKEYGSSIDDAECQCRLGYHFENEDQRACVPNRLCGKGYGQSIYGICENCFEKNMWSDTVDKISQCKPLKNCEKESRCTLVKSNGTYDNKCGQKVSDVSNCDSIIHQTTTPAPIANTGVILGVALSLSVVFILILILIVVLIRRNRRSRKQRTLTAAEREEILQDIIKRCRKDEMYCKKVLTIAQKEVEDKINNQIWALLQELFREHIEPARSEVLLEKYKVQAPKYAVNGYMKDWRGWRGDTGEAVEELVRCLKSEKVKREDIVYEVVMKLREDDPEVVYASTNKRSSKPNAAKSICANFFPCACKEEGKDSYEIKETSSKLLDAQTINERDNGYMPPPSEKSGGGFGGGISPPEAGVAYRNAPTPSAPLILEEPDFENAHELKGSHFYDRSDSAPGDTYPVQASS